MRYLDRTELDLFLRDLRLGPSMRFRRVVVRRVAGEVCVGRLARAQRRLIAELPELAERIRRDERGWHYEPCSRPPEIYVETHQIDGDHEAARTRLIVERDRPLDPVTGPLMRVSVLRYRSGNAHVLLALHELVARMCSSREAMRWLLTAATEAPARI